MEITKSQINKLGERIRKENKQEGDLKLLDDFRNSYGEAFKEVLTELKKILKPFSKKVHLTNRQTKTSISIKEKLIRLKSRLSEMQDIRGCRIVTDDLITSNKIIKKITASKIKISKKDIRDDNIGYRATHLIALAKEKPVEIQVRTRLEDFFANVCEKYSSKENDLKYGNRDEKVKNLLTKLSKLVKSVDKEEMNLQLAIKDYLSDSRLISVYKTAKELKKVREIRESLIKMTFK